MPASVPPSLARRRLGFGAVLALTVGWALLMQSLGWAQTSYYALVKSLSDGTPQIDRYHWETRDKSWTGGHFYSVKAPGLSVLTLPLYEGLTAVGAPTLAREAADTARAHGARQWTYRGLNVHSYGGVPRRAAQIKRRLEVQAPMVWALGSARHRAARRAAAAARAPLRGPGRARHRDRRRRSRSAPAR